MNDAMVFFLGLLHRTIFSCFIETPVKDKLCKTYSPSSSSLIEVGTLCSLMDSRRLYWATLSVTISILVNHALISIFFLLLVVVALCFF